jgi:hypothetical protein
LSHVLLALGNDHEAVPGKLSSLKTGLGCVKKSLDAASKRVNLKAVRGIKADSLNDMTAILVSEANVNLARKSAPDKIFP